MGAKKTLEDFLAWGATMFPAENYFLVLWGHAYGLGFGRDHGDKLTLKELTGGARQVPARTECRRSRCKLKWSRNTAASRMVGSNCWGRTRAP